MREWGKLRYAGIAGAALLASCATAPSPATPDPSVIAPVKTSFDRAIHSYFDCVYAIAERYAKTEKFTPDDISTAATADCSNQMNDQVEAFRRYSRAQKPDWSEQLIQSASLRYARDVEAETKKNVIALVLRVRSGN